MKRHSLVLVPLLVFALAACDNDPAKGKPQATVAEPAKVDPAKPSAREAGGVKHTFSNVGSKVSFVGAKVTGKHEGGFGTFTGTVMLVEQDPTKSSVTAEIEVASLTTDAEKLTGHLKSPDLLDVEKYPKARFTSTSIKAGGDKGATHTVTGNFELHGATKSITFPATIKVSGDAVEVDAEFAISRKEFGILYPGKPNDLIKDDVLIKLEIRAKKS